MQLSASRTVSNCDRLDWIDSMWSVVAPNGYGRAWSSNGVRERRM